MSDDEVSADIKDLMRRLYTECDDTHRTSHINDKENQLYCPHRFDGYVCWPRTIAGTTVYQQCPDFVTGFNDRLLAYKECHQNGTWYTHPETGAEWSNYTTCIDVGDFEKPQMYQNSYSHPIVHVVGAELYRMAYLVQSYYRKSRYSQKKFVFLVNVVRVLCNKLHPGTAQLAPMALQKALRATLILVPLFGLHYILLPFRPEAGSSLDKIYQITSSALISLQGVCVSCLFCFVNHDVLYEIRSCCGRLFPRLLKPIHVTKHDAPPGSQTRDIIV
ncbi:hypothetical protein HA402_009081 [Bradysia odoriphaga]|nr:hypothetical protein HA402_009081 [Bradysia odoriphaga]